MTSTLPQPGVPDEIQALFSWNPATLIPGPALPSRKPSTSTGAPAFYDKHFSDHLILQKVVRLPTLVRELASNVDTALQAASNTLPPMKDFIFTARERRHIMSTVDEIVADEKGVTNYYSRTAATFCAPLASTLALHPTASQWCPLLFWTQSVFHSGYAIMGGVLRFIGEGTGEMKDLRAAVVEEMESEKRRIFEDMRGFTWPLATWEIKSLSAGSAEVMNAVPNLGKFSWTTCDAPNCDFDLNHVKETEKVTKVVVGPDAQTPPWSFSNTLDAENSDEEIEIQLPAPHIDVSSATPQRPASRRVTQSAAGSGSLMLPPPPPRASRSSEHGSPTKDRGKKRKLDDADADDDAYQDRHDMTAQSPSAAPQRSASQRVTRSATRSGSSMLPPPPPPSASRSSPMKDKGKRYKQDGDSDDKAYQDQPDRTAQSLVPPPPPSAARSSEHESPVKDKDKRQKRDNDDDKAFQDRPDRTAQSLVQQAWAQAVRVDGTVIVLHSGNHEVVCVRHRSTQTLYVSDVIEPPKCANPGYGKLQVGIYIAAIQDTIDRYQQRTFTMSQLSGGDFIGSDQSRDDRDDNRGSGSDHKDGRGGRGVGKGNGFQGSAAFDVRWSELCQPCDEPDKLQEMIRMASNLDMVLLYLQYDVYDSPVPASFFRSAPSILTHTRCPTLPLSPRAMHIYSLEESLIIVLTSEIGRGATGVVHRGTLKLGISFVPLDVVVKLAFDVEQRDALRSEYEVYRRLSSKGIRGIATVLGLFDDSEDGACALVMLYAGAPLVTEPQRILSVSDRKSALSTLGFIHLAGILHGDIRRSNILMGDLGVTIIDFGHSKQSNDQEAKDKEYEQLRYLLDYVTSECSVAKPLT